MLKVELAQLAARVAKMFENKNLVSWGMTLDETESLSLDDLYYLHSEYGLNMVKDNRGCLAFTR